MNVEEYCCIPGCINRYMQHNLLTYKITKKRKDAWMRVICRPDIAKMTTKYSKFEVCARHFEQRMIKGYDLIPNAVPTLYLPKYANILVRDVILQVDSHNKNISDKPADFHVSANYGLRKLNFTNECKTNLDQEPSTSYTFKTDPLDDESPVPATKCFYLTHTRYKETQTYITYQDVPNTNINILEKRDTNLDTIDVSSSDSDVKLIGFVEDNIDKDSNNEFIEQIQDNLAMNANPELEEDDLGMVFNNERIEGNLEMDIKNEIIEDNLGKDLNNEWFKDNLENISGKGDKVTSTIPNQKDVGSVPSTAETIKLSDDEIYISKMYENVFKDKFIKMKRKLRGKYKGYFYYKKFRQYCLNLYCTAPKAYKFFQKQFSLPSEEKLFNTKLNLFPGINEPFIELVSNQLKSMPSKTKYVTLCLDEIPLTEHLFYDIRSDEIIGYHHVNGIKSSETAVSAIVARTKGCFHNYEQLIGYGLLGRTFDCNNISNWIDDTIRLLFKHGVVVCAVVSHMTPNMSYLAMMKGVTSEDPFFLVDEKIIFYLFDTPDLINCVRNELLTSIFLYDECKIVSWEYVKAFYNNQFFKKFNLAPKLTLAHIEPTPSQCTVKRTKEVFSYSVAAGITNDIELGCQSAEASGTADFITKMNYLYDLFSSTSLKDSHQYKKPFTGADYQNKCLLDICSMFLGLRTFDSVTGLEKHRPECLAGIIITIQAFLQLHKYFLALGIKTFHTKRLHQNSKKLLSTLFSQESLKQKSKSMTPIQLKRCFSKLALKNLLNSRLFSKAFYDSTSLDKAISGTDSESGETDFSLLENYFPNGPNTSPLSVNTVDYRTAGRCKDVYTYLIDTCLAMHKCDEFEDYVHKINTIKEENSDSSVTEATVAAMIDPRPDFTQYVQNCQTLFLNDFDITSLQKDVGSNLLKTLQLLVSPIKPCPCFSIDYLNKLFIRWSIYSTLKLKVKKLKENELNTQQLS